MVFATELQTEINTFQYKFDDIIVKMEDSLRNVVKEHDQEVIFACLTHLLKAKEDAVNLKYMLESQLQANEEFRNFEKNAKELNFFRKEVLRLSKKLDTKDKECNKNLRIIQELKDDNMFLKSQVEFLFARLRKKDPIEFAQISHSLLNDEDGNILVQKENMISKLKAELNSLKLEMNSLSNYENIYQKLFISCIEEVKGSLNKTKNLKEIGFRFLSLDKIKVLENFFKNEDIINLLKALLFGNTNAKEFQAKNDNKTLRELKRLTIIPKRKTMILGSIPNKPNLNRSYLNIENPRLKSKDQTNTKIEESIEMELPKSKKFSRKVNTSFNI